MGRLEVLTVYKDPRDNPGKWVLRGFDVRSNGTEARADCVVADSLDEVRRSVPVGCVRLGRSGGDDPCVYESWV
jgi:hypothetical protein